MNSPMRSVADATGELGFLTLYFPAIDRASGHFDANLSSRLWRRPRPVVSSNLRRRTDLYQLNLAMRALDLEARASNRRSSVPRRGAGTLAARQDEWRDKLPYGEISVDGENLRVIDVPEARIDASRISTSTSQARNSREARSDSSRIQPADLTNAVLPSADERLVGPTEALEKTHFW
jgi:hypothetical protein